MMIEIAESGKYEAHVFLGQWSIWKDDGQSKIAGMREQVCIFPPTYRNPRPVAMSLRVADIEEEMFTAEIYQPAGWAKSRLKKNRKGEGDE